MSQQKKSSAKKIILIILGILAMLAAIFLVFTIYTFHTVVNSEEFKEFEAKQRKLGEEITYYVDQDLLSVNIYDPGSDEWAPVENACTEDLQTDVADFDGFHFITAAGHDEGSGYFVMSKTEEDTKEPSQYAVFRLEMKDHKITEVTDAQLVDNLRDYDFSS